MEPTWVGIDLGASRIDAVVVGDGTGGRARVVDARCIPADAIDEVVALTRDATLVAIDAPSELSTAPHRNDESVNRKFRVARCGEIALGEQARIWVPWVTPADPDAVPGWMQVGFALWAALRDDGHEPVEVYPAGIFRTLAGGRVPRKTSPEGLARRRALLATDTELPPMVEAWTHDAVDALAAALTARQCTQGRARRCGHDGDGCDGSAVWLPTA